MDSIVKSPSERAEKILNILSRSNLTTDWDVLCFCTEYVAGSSLSNPWLKELAEELIRIVYIGHYGKDFHKDERPLTGLREDTNDTQDNGTNS